MSENKEAPNEGSEQGMPEDTSIVACRNFSGSADLENAGECSPSKQAAHSQEDTPPSPTVPQETKLKYWEEIEKADATIQELNQNCASLQEKASVTIATIKQLLNQKEVELSACYKATLDYKVGLVNQYKDQLLSQEEDRPAPSPPTLSGGPWCGFIPEVTNLVHSAACLMLEHRAEIQPGEEMSVSVIGSLTNSGHFWVRLLPDDAGLQDVMLQNLSNGIGVELSLSFSCLESANVGDLCCALYSEDQRWYRGRIVEIARGKKAKVYFLDYGNTELISYSNLSRLHPKFQVYPFQMIRCCFSMDQTLVYEREVRWKFTDMTHGSDLTIKILKRLPDTALGKLHLVQLNNCSGAEPFDVGVSITMMASMSPAQPNAIKYRDIRYSHAPSAGSHAPSAGNKHVSNAQSAPKLSQAPPKTTPTISVAAPTENKTKLDEDAVKPGILVSAAEEKLKSYPNPTTKQPSLQETLVSNSDQSIPDTSSVRTDVTSPSHTAQEDRGAEADPEKVELGQAGSCVPGDEGSQVGVQRSPRVGDVAEAKTGEVESSTGSDVITPSAQTGVSEAAPEPSPHSTVPIPAVTADAGSRSHSPIPIPVASVIDTTVKGSTHTVTSNNHISLKQGEELEVYVTTPLSPNGSFWVQLASAEQAEFQNMVEQLQKCCRDEPPTPVFFSPGDVCAAQFSEDSCWYRARVEDIVEGEFLVHYLDFGNSETRPREFLVALRSEYRVTPFMAFQCSIACPDHTSFSAKEIKCFEEVTDAKKLNAKILSVDQDKVASVQLLLSVPATGTVDLNEEVYTADVKIGESLSFTFNNTPQGEGPIPIESVKEIGVGASWADFMDDLESPQNDGIFTLAGQESSSSRSSRSHTPTPTRPSLSPQPRRSTPPPSGSRPQSHTPLSQDSSQKERERSRNHSPRSRTPTSAGPQTRNGSVPRIHTNALGMVRKNLLIAEKSSRERLSRDRAKSDQPLSHTKLNATSDTRTRSSLSPGPTPTMPPGLPQPKGIRSINQVSRNGTSFPPTGRRRKSPEPDSTQIMDREGGQRAIEGLNGNQLAGSPKPLCVQPYKVASVQSPDQAEYDCLPSHKSTRLFVKNIPLNRSMEDVKTLFSQFGTVIGVVPVPNRKNVVYMYMEPESAKLAIDGLHGKAVAKFSKPLIVEVSQPPRAGKSRS